MQLYKKSVIRNILEKHGLFANKNFGQNFLIDKNILDKIVDTADIKKSDHIIEVGPGLGVLTEALIEKSDKITAIELDKKLIPILKENFGDKITLLNQDALKFKAPITAYKVVANIPYNITSPLINHFVQSENPPESLTLLVQKEVADKIIDTKKMSILSLQVALFADVKIITKVPPTAFFPPPKVNSAVIQIIPHNKIAFEKALKILKLAKQAFTQKRKKLGNTLPKELLEKAGIAPDKRPQHLSIEDWERFMD